MKRYSRARFEDFGCSFEIGIHWEGWSAESWKLLVACGDFLACLTEKATSFKKKNEIDRRMQAMISRTA